MGLFFCDAKSGRVDKIEGKNLLHAWYHGMCEIELQPRTKYYIWDRIIQPTYIQPPQAQWPNRQHWRPLSPTLRGWDRITLGRKDSHSNSAADICHSFGRCWSVTHTDGWNATLNGHKTKTTSSLISSPASSTERTNKSYPKWNSLLLSCVPYLLSPLAPSTPTSTSIWTASSVVRRMLRK